MYSIENIAIVGHGLAGAFFEKAFSEKNYNVLIFSRNPSGNAFSMEDLYNSVNNFDLILLCVNDDAIASVSKDIPSARGIIAHVSGATKLETLSSHHPHRAVVYPLMSLKDNEAMVISSIPFCLESPYEDDFGLLADLIKSLGAQWFAVDSEKRSHLHLAAVFVQNFSNHLYYLGQKIMEDAELDFKILIPLIHNAVDRLRDHNAFDLQTGPAIRHDEASIRKHLELINDPLTKEIYKLLTESIQNIHDQKL